MQTEPVAIAEAVDLNGLTITLQGDNADKQADALRRLFPTARVAITITEPLLRRRTRKEIAIYVSAALALMVVGHMLLSYFTWEKITVLASSVEIGPEIFYFLMAGFVAQMIDGALGMAYGVTATTFLMSVGISPLHATASVHSSEIFTSGVSGYMHIKFGNINSKLFKAVLIPGVIGAALGAWLISELSSFEYYAKMMQPVISVYTAFLGILIIHKALTKRIKKKPVRSIGLLAWTGGFLDSIGGGGWGPVVTSNLSSLPEVVGDAALLVPPTDSDALCHALLTLINSSSVRAELAHRALERASLFSWERFIREHISLYKGL